MPAETTLERTLVNLVAIPRRLWAKIEARVLALLIFGCAIFIATALASWSPSDPSTYSLGYPKTATLNLAGQYGADIASFLFFWLGFCAYTTPLIALHACHCLMSKAGRPGKLGFLISWSGILIATSFLAQFYAVNWTVGPLRLDAGGVLGNLISSELLRTVGPVGSFILVLTMLSVCCITNFPNSLHRSENFLKEVALAQIFRSWFAIKNSFFNFLGLFKRAPKTIVNENEKVETVDIRGLDVPVGNLSSPTSPPLENMDDAQEFTFNLSQPDPSSNQETSAKTPYAPPPTTIFKKTSTEMNLTPERKAEFERRAAQLIEAFADFGINGKVASIQPGPVVTVYEFEPDAGTKISKIMGLIDDIALALKVDSVFMLPAKGKRAIGVQVPNKSRETVLLGDLVSSSEFKSSESPLTIAMGKSLTGDPVCSDLAAMPHLLTAGATGAGKSVAINALLCSIIMKSTPEQVRLILVDPKMLELSVYEGIPHLLMPVITDPSKASLALKWATFEMERRYRLMQLAKVRHIHGFNSFWQSASEDERQKIRDECLDDSIEALPFIVLVIDELADLMLTAPKDVETSIQRLAQKARASGIHLVLATQRPSVDIITGVIKANLPCRIAFQTVSKHDSRTILDQNGADKLLGRGDMLFMKPGTSRLERIQGTFIDDAEVIGLVDNIKANDDAHYDANIIGWIDKEYAKQNDGPNEDFDESEDPKYEDAMRVAQTNGAISASFLQRQLKIGYNRAARIVEQMEMRGLVGKADGSKPREWLGPSL